MTEANTSERGFTLVELTVALVVFSIVALSLFSLFVSLMRSTVIAKRQAVATTLATNQMEYLKSLPYDSLAVAGGSIYTPSPLPATTTKTLNGVKYTLKTSINYVDDAYDGCASYPSQALKELYCRNYPPPSGAPAVDSNPQDYKIAHVLVSDPSGNQLAQVDTQISARVSETASTTGALFVNIIDSNGNAVSGAIVTVSNTTINPNITVSDSSDSYGTSIFYGLPPDGGTDYHIAAVKAGYSTLNTIVVSGSLQPTYPSQKVFTQQSSYVTLVIKQQGTNSVVLETVNTSGSPLANVKVYIKGGYKKYTDTADTAYYYDTLSPADTRPTTDSSGLFALQNLAPGSYVFCGDSGATSCSIGGTTYYLAAAVPYGGTNSFNPVVVPTYDPAAPPSTTFDHGGTGYLQKVRLILTTNAGFPRIQSLSPSSVSLGDGTLANLPFTISGFNLPCAADPASCATSVRFEQGSSSYSASCTGSAAGTDLSCSVNLLGVTQGVARMVVSVGGQTLTLPAAPLLGGIIVAS